MRKDLFFIALLPPPDIQAEVTAFKQQAARKFHSAHALRSPPHITLYPPFRWPADRLRQLEASLRDFALGEAPFDLELYNFDCFRPRVIFVDILPNPALAAFQQRLRERLEGGLQLKHRDHRPYHPHLTIAFRDLRRSVFAEAWAHFSQIGFERSFPVKAVTLLRHEDHRWEIAKNFELGEGKVEEFSRD